MFEFLKRRPDFLIVGAQKAGTSALEFFLHQHPRIRSAHRKEVGFFSRDQVYQRGADWYEQQFPRRHRPGMLLFEATPEYLYYPFVAERILQFNPRIKLIALLRDPVERAYSAWNMFRLMHSDATIRAATIRDYLDEANPECREPLIELLNRAGFPDFDTCIRQELGALRGGRPASLEPSFVRRGLYAEQVERFHHLFPADNLLILESRELKASREAALNRVLGFLGLGETDWARNDLRDKHVRPYSSALPPATDQMLREYYRPHNARLYSILGRDFGWDPGLDDTRSVC